MQTENRSLRKLDSIARFLKLSGKFYFVNYNLKLFYDFVRYDGEIGTIIQKLLLKYPSFEEDAKTVLTHPNQNISDYRSERKVHSFEEWVAFCIFYVKAGAEQPGGNPFLDKVIGLYDGSGYDKERKDITQCFNDIIEPVLIYIELQIQQTQNTLHILQRYKVLCEWYNREKLFSESEPEITKNHLSKYLFDQGFTYSLVEATVPSGKVDNFASNMGLKDKYEFSNLPDAILSEGKIFDGNKADIQDVRDQINKRMEDLGFLEGFCIVFNKTALQINFSVNSNSNSNGRYSDGFYVLSDGGKTTFFMVINLDSSFSDSTFTNKEVAIELI